MSAAAQTTNTLRTTPLYRQTQAPSVNILGANERIAVAIIGVGWGCGQNHLLGIYAKSKVNP